MDNLTSMPATIVAGSTVKLTLTYGDFPADAGWALKLYLAGARIIAPVTGSASGKGFNLTLSSTVTATLVEGTYQWEARATKSGETYVAEAGLVRVQADISAARAGDRQAWAERALAVVEARIEGRLTADQEEFQIHGRAVKRIPMSELLGIRAQLKAELRGAAAAAGGGVATLRTVRARFSGIESEV